MIPRLVGLPSLALLVLGLWSDSSWAEDTSIVSVLDKLPSCAVTCLKTAITDSPCSLDDQTCICSDTSLHTNASACISRGCSVKEGLLTKNATETACGAPIRDKSKQGSDVAASLGIITAVLVVARVLFKAFVVKTGLGWDDWFVLFTTITGVPSTTFLALSLPKNGLGKDIWTLPYSHITKFGMYFFAVEILYFVEVVLLKTSILCFYLRIFTTTGTRRILWATIILNGLFGVAFVFAGIFQCNPISYYWTKWDGDHQGSCVSINALGWSNAVVSIALDVWMIAIPLSKLKTLNLHWKQKIGVGLMFCVGTFVTVFSILRLSSLVSFANSLNPTWDEWGVVNWSTIEIKMGTICACMPTARLALVRFFSVFGATYRSNPYVSHISSNRVASRTVASVSRPEHRQEPPDAGIRYQKTFNVQYSSDHDETSLIHMAALESSDTPPKETRKGEV